MSYENLLSINDNVFKFFSLLGIVLFVFAVIYPADKLTEVKQLENDTELRSKVLSLQIDVATEKIESFRKIIKQTGTEKNVRDSLQYIVDTTDYSIKRNMFELEYQSNMKEFSKSQYDFFKNYRNYIIGTGIGLFVLGSFFWIVFFIKREKKGGNQKKK